MLLADFKHKARCFFGKEDVLSVLRVFLSDGSSAMVLYRLMSFFQGIGLGIIGWVFAYLNKVLNGCVIGRRAKFGAGFVIMHPIGIVINGAVEGGKNIVLESGVVIGAAQHGLPVRVPKLGHDIFIGAGAKLIGDIRVGNNVQVGANAVVVKSVADNQSVVGIPARPVEG